MSFERRFGEFEDQNAVAVGVSQKPTFLRDTRNRRLHWTAAFLRRASAANDQGLCPSTTRRPTRGHGGIFPKSYAKQKSAFNQCVAQTLVCAAFVPGTEKSGLFRCATRLSNSIERQQLCAPALSVRFGEDSTMTRTTEPFLLFRGLYRGRRRVRERPFARRSVLRFSNRVGA